MAKKHKKKHRLEKAALIVSIINGLVTAVGLPPIAYIISHLSK